MSQRVKKRSKNGCRCSYCEFHYRGGWWKRVLIERDIKKEVKSGGIEGRRTIGGYY